VSTTGERKRSKDNATTAVQGGGRQWVSEGVACQQVWAVGR